MSKASKTARKITARLGTAGRLDASELEEWQLTDIVTTHELEGPPLYEWSGEDRAGHPLRVLWAPSPHVVSILNFIEITD